MKNIALLKKLCEVAGAPGFEQRVRNLITAEIGDVVDALDTDAMGNVVATLYGESEQKVMIGAHMDEISFIVTHIDDNGFVRFHTLGGFDPKTLTAQRVIIHGKKDIIGVMGTKPIHIMTPEERNKMPKTTDFFIDTGLTKTELEEFISIGSPITRERELIQMGKHINSKSLDNRVSVFILIETLKRLKGAKLPYTVVGVFTVQEEVGLRGAMTSASGVNPDFGIALDVTLANDMPGAAPHEEVTKLGQGTAIKILDGATICDYRMVNFMKEVAIQYNIMHQMEILTAGGTDTAGIQRGSQGGAIAGAISIPCRYLHQVIEMVHEDDVKASIDLLEKCLLDMGGYDWSFR